MKSEKDEKGEEGEECLGEVEEEEWGGEREIGWPKNDEEGGVRWEYDGIWRNMEENDDDCEGTFKKKYWQCLSSVFVYEGKHVLINKYTA